MGSRWVLVWAAGREGASGPGWTELGAGTRGPMCAPVWVGACESVGRLGPPQARPVRIQNLLLPTPLTSRRAPSPSAIALPCRKCPPAGGTLPLPAASSPPLWPSRSQHRVTQEADSRMGTSGRSVPAAGPGSLRQEGASGGGHASSALTAPHFCQGASGSASNPAPCYEGAGVGVCCWLRPGAVPAGEAMGQ